MDCCAPKAGEGARVPCPGCGQVGRPVARATVEAILDPAFAATLPGAAPRFCRTPACGVLYYGSDGQSAHKRQARVRVGIKETEAPIPLCYCFGFSRADVEREIAETGDCAIAARITGEIKAGRCACEIKNPAGSCCLGEVHREIEEAKSRQAPGVKTGT